MKHATLIFAIAGLLWLPPSNAAETCHDSGQNHRLGSDGKAADK
jgi:hypothetical protein